MVCAPTTRELPRCDASLGARSGHRHGGSCWIPGSWMRRWHTTWLLTCNWLQVFKRAHSALLGSGGGPEQRTSLVPSEKCAVGWASDDDEMRMITASFVR